MALTGIQIYKFLPKTNCKKCGFPTCLAFAMKLSQAGVELSKCPDISEEGKQALSAAARPPIRLVAIGAGDKKFEVGGETVLFRHEKTFFHPAGVMVKVKDSLSEDAISKLVTEAAAFNVERVGKHLTIDGFAIDNDSKDAAKFATVVGLVKAKSNLPLTLMSANPAAIEGALAKVAADRPLVYAATKDNADAMIALAKKHNVPLAVADNGLAGVAAIVEKANAAGLEDLVIDSGARGFGASLSALTQIRRLALKKSFNLLGYPVITFPGAGASSPEEEAVLAGQQIAKYAGVVVLDNFAPGLMYPLLTLRMNIYTDPQKPIQVQPGIYPIGDPKETSPLLVSTNFSLTYFSIAGEVEASGFPSWLLINDTEGLSVLTAWAAGKFDADKIAKSVKQFNAEKTVSHRSIILPGKVAVLRGELEEALPGWKIMVGPPEAMDIGGYLKKMWAA